MQSEQEKLQIIVGLGQSQKCAAIHYMKQTGEESQRLAEPYCLQRNGPHLMVMTWQVNPETGEPANWRNFRIDRMVEVADGNCDFAPRRVIDLDPENAPEFSFEFEPGGSLAGMNSYFEFVQTLLLEGKLGKKKREEASSLSSALSTSQVRAVHAQAFSDALRECLLDGLISESETMCLASARKLLKRLGWAPGN